MIILDSATKSVKVVLGAVPATNQLDITASYQDTAASTYPPGSNDTVTNSTTPVVAVASPATGKQRQVKMMTVYNADTAPAVVTLQYVSGANTRVMLKITLKVGATLLYTERDGFEIMAKF